MHYSKTELLRKMSIDPWFAALPLAERRTMLALAQPLVLQAGDVIYRKGDAAVGFYGVADGRLRVFATGEDGREGILGMLEAGNWFGEAAMIDGSARPHTAVALEDMLVLHIAPVDFHSLMARSAFAQGVAKLLCARLRSLFVLVEDAMLRTTRVRVARRIVALSRGDTTPGRLARTSVQVSHEDLAMMLGVTRQTLAKELKHLVRAEVLALGYGRIDILSPESLLREAALA
ncbi:MAG: Crp/Fnr family transcriptional regulator [Rhodoferax sp.]|nr:Crp/Fnr family transcriptional regulator [Rhodoferax sp.]